MHEFDKQIEEALRERPVVPVDVVASTHVGGGHPIKNDVHHVFDDVSMLLDGVVLRLLTNDDADDVIVSFDNAIDHLIAYGFLTRNQVGKAQVDEKDADAYAAYVEYRKGLVERYGDDFDMEYVLYARDHELMRYRLEAAARDIEREVDRVANIYRMEFDGVLNAVIVEHERRLSEQRQARR